MFFHFFCHCLSLSCPLAAATNRGVWHSLFGASLSAPASHKTRTTLSCPLAAATNRGVWPSLFGASLPAPASLPQSIIIGSRQSNLTENFNHQEVIEVHFFKSVNLIRNPRAITRLSTFNIGRGIRQLLPSHLFLFTQFLFHQVMLLVKFFIE